MLDALGFLLVLGLLGSFLFWLVGYFVYEIVRHWIRGPSEQLKSVGLSLGEPIRVAEHPTSKVA